MVKKYVRKMGVPFLLFFIFCFSSSVKAEKGLAGWWKFNEGTGDVLHDSSGNGNDGKIYGAKWVKDEIGSALLFDGDDYVDCLSTFSTQLDGPLTISVWLNIPSASAKSKTSNWYPVSRHDWNIGIGDNLIPFFESWNSLGTKRDILSAGRKIPTDEWVNLVAVYNTDDEIEEFYINGEMTNYQKRSDGVISGYLNWSLMFGRESLLAIIFIGNINEVKIYSRALSAEEINKDYELSGKAKSKPLIYPLNVSFSKITPLYGQKKLMVELSMKQLLSGINLKDIELELNLSNASSVIKQRKLKIKGSSKKHQVIFDMKDVPSGLIRLNGIIRDDKGKEMSNEVIKDFTWLPKELEKFTWVDSKEGISEEVLAPWTPIEVKEKGKDLIVKVWGRTYQFNNSPFPTSIETKGDSILSEPIRVIAKVDGKNVNLKWERIKIKKQTPGIISFERSAEWQGLNLSAVTQIEYDGLVRIDWKIASEKSLELEELIFEIPIKEKHAKYIYTKGYQDIVGFIPKDGWRTPFIPMIWLGDEDTGLQWFCESYNDWYNIEEKRSIEILPKKDVMILRLHLVDRTISMKPGKRLESELGIPVMQSPDNVVELSYTFGLQATPVKPVTKDVWDYRFIHVGAGAPSLDIPVGRYSGEKFHVKESNLDSVVKDGVKTMAYHESWTDSFCSTSTPYAEDLKKLVKDCHNRGIQFLLYIGMAIADTIPEYSLFNEECVRMSRNVWTISWGGWNMPPHSAPDFCLASVWSDYLADGFAKTMIDQYDIDGLYLDGPTSTCGGCKNVLHGCGYIGLDGNVKRTYALFAGRELMRRFYTIVKQRKPEGQINLHNSTEMFSPVLSWVTSYWNGEHLGADLGTRGLSKKSPLLKKMPLDYFRTEFMGRQWGIAAEFLEYTFTDDLMESLTLSLLHDVPIRIPYLMSPIWKLMDEFGRKESEWLPYWKNKEYVSIKPEGGVRLSSAEVKDVYVSLYKHPKNGVLAVVSNLGETDVKNVIVQLNLEKLKLKDKEKLFAHTMTVSLSDDKQKWLTLTDEKPINIDDGIFDLNIPFHGWKIIWVK